MRNVLKIENLINFMEEKYDLVFMYNFRIGKTNFYDFLNPEYQDECHIYSLRQLRDIYRGE